jgi:hypothetical protein
VHERSFRRLQVGIRYHLRVWIALESAYKTIAVRAIVVRVPTEFAVKLIIMLYVAA